MTTRDRAVFLMGAAATALLLFGTPYPTDADSRRHIFKPVDEPVNVTRDVDSGGGAPEIDPASLGLALSLVAGTLAVLAGRRRPPHS